MPTGRNAPRDRGANSPIAAARMAAGLTQAQLAERVGCTQKDLSRWERRIYMPKAKTLSQIAQALGCKIDDLIM